MPRKLDPYALICNSTKTTLTAPCGIALGFGPGPGLRSAIFWNRVGSLFSSYRPAIAVLTLFDARDTHHPVALTTRSTKWEPNLATAHYTAPGLALEERRTALKAGLRCLLKLKSTVARPRDWVLFFHGQVQQWEFFDYQRGLPEPQVTCTVEPHLRRVRLVQPHPHSGLPALNSIQTVTLSHKLNAYGFGQDEGDLHALWHDHGCLSCLRMRLGQVGGRLPEPVGAGPSARPPQDEPERKIEDPLLTFAHRHPLYYFAVRLHLEPGEMALMSIATQYQTDDEGGKLAGAYDGTAPDEWQEHLQYDVPQLDCSDRELMRYWYYVWYILAANRTASGAHVKHPFTAPSKYLYWGPWIWDGYFHVLGEMWLKDAQVAKDSIRAVLEMQFPNGFLPVCSGSQYRMCFHDEVPGYSPPTGKGGYASYIPPKLAAYKEREHPFEAELTYVQGGRRAKLVVNEKTQTPLIGVAAADFCELRGDKAFAREAAAPLWAYEEWLWRRRTDSAGRFILWHGDESGWDNATRHYPVPAKPFDVQVHALMHREALLRLARIAGGAPWEAELERRVALTRAALRTYWCKRDRWHYDFAAKGDGEQSGRRRRQIAPSGLFALLVEQSAETVKWCLNALAHERVFSAPHPIPTLARCDPDYAPHGWGWNGPVWLQVNFFTIVGLLNAGQYAAAFKLWQSTRALIIRDSQPYSHEMYDPETGTGMGCPDYSWQAMINHLIIHRFAGAGLDGRTIAPALPPGMTRLAVSNLPGLLSSLALERRGKRVVITASYAEATAPILITAGLGEAARVSSHGEAWESADGSRWAPPQAAHPREQWEIIVTCR
jgi:hypothetical protein